VAVHLYDAMPSLGRKFLLAGIGGLNLTHNEPQADFVKRYFEQSARLQPLLNTWGATEIRSWAQGLGVDTFVGSSGRVFPTAMKAAPLLRAWLHRLRGMGVQIHARHRWLGWDALGQLQFQHHDEVVKVSAQTTLLALGGGSWPQLGSDAAWLPWLLAKGVAVKPLQAANCGFECAWSAHFSERHAGAALKSIALTVAGDTPFQRKGECIASHYGLEGSLIYAASRAIRDKLNRSGECTIQLDLLPDWSPNKVLTAVAHPRGSRSLSNHLKGRLPLDPVKLSLLYECLSKAQLADPTQLATAIKALPIRLTAARPLAEAISSAGGVAFEALSEDFECLALPGVFCAGEMLDWEAPTGGYLLTAVMCSARHAAQGMLTKMR
jgi:uncharacterized flavoprotein (TIGR03862 family)